MLFQQLDSTKNDSEANQYTLVLNLPNGVRDQLADDKNTLDGIPFRFIFEGQTGLIKIVSSYSHDAAARRFAGRIMAMCRGMGFSMKESNGWMGSVFHYTSPALADATQGKSADECSFPLERRGGISGQFEWPTLVIETGVPKSLPRLEQDARWWLANSGSAVRIVLLLIIDRGCETIDLQLISPERQQPYNAQTARITTNDATGDLPIVIHPQALLDQGTLEGGSIVLDAQTLVDIARFV